MKLESLPTIDNGIEVKPSTISGAGNGLFAKRIFRRGEYITLYEGELLTRHAAKLRPVLTHMASREGIVIDGLKLPIRGRGGGSFANGAKHVYETNAYICAYLGILVLRARLDIEIDTEIIVCYGRRGFDIACPQKSEENYS